VDDSDNIVFAQFSTFAGLLLSPACLLGGSWVWYAASALLLVVSLLSAVQWWRLWQRKKELLRQRVKEPDTGKPPHLEGIERLLRE
jgi:membrane protein implicated in regulation of membrane protease activity